MPPLVNSGLGFNFAICHAPLEHVGPELGPEWWLIPPHGTWVPISEELCSLKADALAGLESRLSKECVISPSNQS